MCFRGHSSFWYYQNFLKGFETALALCVVKYESRIRVTSVNKAAGV